MTILLQFILFRGFIGLNIIIGGQAERLPAECLRARLDSQFISVQYLMRPLSVQLCGGDTAICGRVRRARGWRPGCSIRTSPGTSTSTS